MQLEIAYTNLAFWLNGAIDRGQRADLDQTHRRCLNGEAFDFIDSMLPWPDADLSLHKNDPNIVADINERFGSLANAIDHERKFMVKNEGLCLLVAYCIESIQQLVAHD